MTARRRVDTDDRRRRLGVESPTRGRELAAPVSRRARFATGPERGIRCREQSDDLRRATLYIGGGVTAGGVVLVRGIAVPDADAAAPPSATARSRRSRSTDGARGQRAGANAAARGSGSRRRRCRNSRPRNPFAFRPAPSVAPRRRVPRRAAGTRADRTGDPAEPSAGAGRHRRTSDGRRRGAHRDDRHRRPTS